MPQHQACLDVMVEGIVHGGYSGVLKEAEVFNELILQDTSKGATSKVPNVTDVGIKPRHIKKVAVIGGGLMGSGIATALLLGNIYVVLKEINSNYLAKGIKMIEGGPLQLKWQQPCKNATRPMLHKNLMLSISIVLCQTS